MLVICFCVCVFVLLFWDCETGGAWLTIVPGGVRTNGGDWGGGVGCWGGGCVIVVCGIDWWGTRRGACCIGGEKWAKQKNEKENV